MNLQKLSYQDIVQYLLKKYGPAKMDYFTDASCLKKNAKVSRAAAGLECHHIDEDKAIQLSRPEIAAQQPFAYQKKDRLVYANLLEHLILHIKIAEHPSGEAPADQLPGIGGAMILTRMLNDVYSEKELTSERGIAAKEKVKDNFDDFITALRYLSNVIRNDPAYAARCSDEDLALDWNGTTVEKTAAALHED